MRASQGKIPVSINPSFWITAAIIAWLVGGNLSTFFSWMIVVLVSVLVHEFGHALTARFWGLNSEIILGPFGGVTSYRGGPLTRIQEFTVVLAGPIFGFLLAAAAYTLLIYAKPVGQASYFLYSMALANIVWSLFNLLPVHPFDGGKLMGIVFEGLFGFSGMRFSYLLSGIFAVALSILFLLMGQIIAFALLLLSAFESFRSWNQNRYFLTTESEKELEVVEKAEGEWDNRQPQVAIKLLERLVKEAKDGEVRTRAVATLAEYLLATGETKKAYQLLQEEKKLEGETLKLYQLLCYKLGYWQQALDAGGKVYRDFQDTSSAILNAFSSAHLSDVRTCINWLTAIKKLGTVDMRALLTATDFEEVRQNDSFIEFSSKF